MMVHPQESLFRWPDGQIISAYGLAMASLVAMLGGVSGLQVLKGYPKFHWDSPIFRNPQLGVKPGFPQKGQPTTLVFWRFSWCMSSSNAVSSCRSPA